MINIITASSLVNVIAKVCVFIELKSAHRPMSMSALLKTFLQLHVIKKYFESKLIF